MAMIDMLIREVRYSAAKLFSIHTYELGNKFFLINANLKDFFEREDSLIKSEDFFSKYENEIDFYKLRDDFYINNLKILSVVISCDEDYPNLISIAERYVYDLFLLINLAVPGACDFYRLTCEDFDYLPPKRYSLSATLFDFSFSTMSHGNFFKAKFLDFDKVLDWYLKLNIGLKNLAIKPIERVIFSIIIITENSDDPATLVWIFNAIESLYSPGGGSSQSLLSKRIAQFLEVGANDLPKFKKSFKHLCDLRNSLFHSGFGVTHPVEVFGAHMEAEDLWIKYFELSDFGFKLILVSVQKLIELDWQGLEFTETFEGSI